MKVSSEPGKGTSFRVLFPVVSEAVQPAVEHEAGAAEWRGEGGVLLVDDEEGIRNIGARLLERLGFQVWTAAEGQQALEIFERDGAAISLVVLDLTMPGMGGEETFRRLRQLRPDLRVILSTGYGEHDAIRHFVGQGLAGFLAKPYTLAKLRTVLREATRAA